MDVSIDSPRIRDDGHDTDLESPPSLTNRLLAEMRAAAFSQGRRDEDARDRAPRGTPASSARAPSDAPDAPPAEQRGSLPAESGDDGDAAATALTPSNAVFYGIWGTMLVLTSICIDMFLLFLIS